MLARPRNPVSVAVRMRQDLHCGQVPTADLAPHSSGVCELLLAVLQPASGTRLSHSSGRRRVGVLRRQACIPPHPDNATRVVGDRRDRILAYPHRRATSRTMREDKSSGRAGANHAQFDFVAVPASDGQPGSRPAGHHRGRGEPVPRPARRMDRRFRRR